MIFAAALVLLLAHESCAGKVQYYPAPEQANSPNVVVEHMWLSNARQAHIKVTSHLTPHTSHLTPHTSHLTPLRTPA